MSFYERQPTSLHEAAEATKTAYGDLSETFEGTWEQGPGHRAVGALHQALQHLKKADALVQATGESGI